MTSNEMLDFSVNKYPGYDIERWREDGEPSTVPFGQPMRPMPAKYKIKTYRVSLPHSCDEWVITNQADKQEAISDMEQFIDKANKALEILKATF